MGTDEPKAHVRVVRRVRLLRFFARHPYLGAVGSLASIVSIPLAIWFFWQARRYPDLVYFVNPAKAVVVKTGETSGLKVSFNDSEITTDVTAAQIAVWNQGNEPISRDDIRKPVVISTEPSVPILEATIRKTNRDVVEVSLDQSHLKGGQLGVSWSMLEEDDGCVVQIVFAGDPATELVASGVIVGQPAINEIRSRETSEMRALLLELGSAMVIFGCVIGISTVIVLLRLRKRRRTDAIKLREEFGAILSAAEIDEVTRSRGTSIGVFLIVLSFTIVVVVAVRWFAERPLGPPFGF